MWWPQPTWCSRFRAFWCLHPRPCGSNMCRPGKCPEAGDSGWDPRHRRRLEIWETEAEQRRGRRGKRQINAKMLFYIQKEVDPELFAQPIYQFADIFSQYWLLTDIPQSVYLSLILLLFFRAGKNTWISDLKWRHHVVCPAGGGQLFIK